MKPHSTFTCTSDQMNKAELTILSFGGGQDSTALLYEYIYNPLFRTAYGINKLLVIIAETGNEHKETYDHIRHISKLCRQHGIEFVQISFLLGFHQGSWRSGLVNFYRKTKTCGSKAFKKTCTDNLKIKPIYRFLNHWVMQAYSLQEDVIKALGPITTEKWLQKGKGDSRFLSAISSKKALKLFADKYGKIQMIIGIAYGEEGRISTDNSGESKWMQGSIKKLYPLVDMKLDRKGCQELIKGYNHEVPVPSNCIICPFLSYQELLYMYRFNRSWYKRWVKLEGVKLKRFQDKGDKNLGVFGKRTLPQALEFATKKFGHMSDAELKDYKMSHGHCVKSKY